MTLSKAMTVPKITRLRVAVRRALVAALLSATSLGAAACTADAGNDDTGASADEIVATLDGHAIDLKRTTRIVLIGDSHELDDLPLRAATTKARRYAQLYPEDQVVLFITKEVSSSDLARTGVRTVTKESFGDVKLSDLSALESDKLIAALHTFRRIGSIDFFGHSSPWGALIETQGSQRTLGPSTPVNLAVLKDNFARDASPYVVLHDGVDAVVQRRSVRAHEAAGLALPRHLGQSGLGLPVRPQLLQVLLQLRRGSVPDVNDVLADFFCSSSADPSTFDGCRNALFSAAASGAAFSPMKSANDYSLECDFTRCEQRFRRDEVNGAPQYRSCVWVDADCSDATSAPDCRTKNTKKQTTSRELRSYLDGQRLLRGE